MVGEIGGDERGEGGAVHRSRDVDTGRLVHRRFYRSSGQDDGFTRGRSSPERRNGAGKEGSARGVRDPRGGRRPRRRRTSLRTSPLRGRRSVEIISLARGVPAPECLATVELADCARAVLERDGATALNYGPIGGYGPLREWLAERHGVQPGVILLTNGSLQGLDLLVGRYAAERRMLVEAPTYDRALAIAARRGAAISSVPHDAEGLDVDALERELRRDPSPAFLYVLPTFQNPSGRTLALDRAGACSSLSTSSTSSSSRTIRTATCASMEKTWRLFASWQVAHTSSTRRPSRRSSRLGFASDTSYCPRRSSRSSSAQR